MGALPHINEQTNKTLWGAYGSLQSSLSLRPQTQPDSSLTNPQSPSWLNISHGPQQQQPPGSGARLPQPQPPQLQQQQSYSPSSSPGAPRLLRGRCYQQQDSQESLSSMPDPGDPTTVTRTYRPGRKASAQASLASRDKTPNAKSRRRRGKGKHAGVCVLFWISLCRCWCLLYWLCIRSCL